MVAGRFQGMLRALTVTESGAVFRGRRPLSIGQLAIVPALIIAVFALAGCTQKFVRNGLPPAEVGAAKPLGMDGLREWGDFNTPDEIERLMIDRMASLKRRFAAEFEAGETPRLQFLALSGGGPDGVSGISTGAIIAPFAFLGPEYDDVLEDVYTTMSTESVLTKTILAGLTGGTALASTDPLRNTIAEYVTPEFMAEISAEHTDGRLLLVGTTNLDAGRPVIWNMGAIATSGHPDALELFRDIILASASIPVAFPPVFIEVDAGGKTYDEMHVDGGATSQVTLVSPQMPLYLTREYLGHDIDRDLYVIVNNRIQPPYEIVRPRINKIGDASVSSLIASQGIGDIYKLYAITRRDDMGFHVVWIPESFREEPDEPFDPVYMRKLYDFGRGLAAGNNFWRTHPPYFSLPES
jgi:hypothetical protein